MTSRTLRTAGLLELLLLALKRRKRFRVEGNSMLPLLKPDDQVLIRPGDSVTLRTGDIVVARHPVRTYLILVKQIESIDDNGRLLLSGLNPDESTDSRQFGSVGRDDIIGVVKAIL